MLLEKLVRDNFQGILGEFSGNFQKILKSTENLLGPYFETSGLVFHSTVLASG